MTTQVIVLNGGSSSGKSGVARCLQAVLPDEVSISRTFWLLMHADSKDLARIRAVADYIYETVERERALFGGRA